MSNTNLDDLIDDIRNDLYAHQFAIKYVLRVFIRGLLWELIVSSVQTEQYRLEEHIDIIINSIVNTAHYTNREDGENYIEWDSDKVKDSINVLHKALETKGFDPKYWKM